MRKFAALFMTTLITLSQASALKAEEIATMTATQEEQKHAPVGDRAMPHAERVVIQELRAQKAKEEAQEHPAKMEELTPAEQFTPKTKVDIQFGKKEAKFGANAYTDYYTTHLGVFHTAVSISFLGDSITLMDGSLWNVYSGDRYKVLYWLTTDSIVILPNDAWLSSYMFKMVNQNTGDSIEVNMTLGPIVYGIFTYWISTVDPVLGYVWLNDGSYWRTSAFDSSIVSKWLPGDTIEIGVNTGFLHLTNPNILINVNTLTYATGECIN